MKIRKGSSAMRLLVVPLASASLLIFAPGAGAAVTIGQLAPGTATAICTNGPFDIVQTATAGNQYVVPTGISQPTITSWSHNAAPGAGQTLSFKVFRKIAEPATYLQVAHDGPRPLVAAALNTFPVNLPVQPGDVIGVNDENAITNPNGCLFLTSAADVHAERAGTLADGAAGPFLGGNTGERVNVTAVVNPSNSFTLGSATRNKNKGNASLAVTVPGPGTLALSGEGIKAQKAGGPVAVHSVNAAGTVKLAVKAKGKKRKKLNSTGKVKVTAKITYTPTGGEAATRSTKVKLLKNL
jgi:hypothetical protein